MAETTNTKEKQTVTLDAASLAEIIKTAVATAVTEARKPSELEQEELEARRELREKDKLKIAADQESRRETALQQKQQLEAKRHAQATCLHEGGRPIHPFTVFVHDPIGGYVLCQGCQAVVRPASQRSHFKGQTNAIFDDMLFTRLFQKTADSGVFA